MLSDDQGDFDTNYTRNNKSFFVPDNNVSGITDSFFVSGSSIITNLKAYVLLSHTYVSDMSVTLTSPAGTSVRLFNRKGGSGNDLMTIFSDAADSSASGSIDPNSPGITPPFSPGIKPEQTLSAFNGEDQTGWWKMKFVDNADKDIGYLHSWGINVTGYDPQTINLSALIQGFYNNTTDKMVNDTIKVLLRNANSPYNVIDSSKSVLDSLGKSKIIFGNLLSSQNFYIAVKHRNSIETWSSGTFNFSSGSVNYDFTSDSSKAFGSNQFKVDQSPVKFAIYNGDVNQNGIVDLVDVIQVYNDILSFVSGYVTTDVNGDNQTDLNDVLKTYNNSGRFVHAVTP